MLWSSDYLAPAWKAWVAPRFNPDVPPADPTVQQARTTLVTHLDVLEARLHHNPWLVCTYSLADVCYAPFVTVFDLIGLGNLLDAHPAVRAWVERLNARPAIKATAPAGPP
jgi:glutathione S-transferase